MRKVIFGFLVIVVCSASGQDAAPAPRNHHITFEGSAYGGATIAYGLGAGIALRERHHLAIVALTVPPILEEGMPLLISGAFQYDFYFGYIARKKIAFSLFGTAVYARSSSRETRWIELPDGTLAPIYARQEMNIMHCVAGVGITWRLAGPVLLRTSAGASAVQFYTYKMRGFPLATGLNDQITSAGTIMPLLDDHGGFPFLFKASVIVLLRDRF